MAAILCMIISVTVSADVQNKKTEPDYKTDYYMIVESKAGGIDIYANPDLEAAKLSEKMIPNGTALHIEGEVEDEAHRRTWGYVQYHGMNGFVPLDDCRPAESRQEAIDSELYLAGRDNVNYQADYDITAENGNLKLYQGPGEKYGTVPGASDIKNGETLHITQDAHMNDGSYWGVTTVEGKQGWVDLDEMKKPDNQENPTPEEGTDGVKDEKASGSADNSLPAEDTESSDMSVSADSEEVGNPEASGSPVSETKGNPRVSPSADPEAVRKTGGTSSAVSETEEKPEDTSETSERPAVSPSTALNAAENPAVTSAPKAVSEDFSEKSGSTSGEVKAERSPAVSEKPESTEEIGESKKESNKETENSTEKNETAGKNTENRAEEKTQETSGQTVKTSSGIPAPFLWIAAIAVGAAVGVLIYHFKKR